MENYQDVLMAIGDYYDSYYKKYGPCMEGAAWGSDIDRLHLRWESIMKVVKKVDKVPCSRISVLDVGCSYGGMLNYINRIGMNVSYMGIDVVSGAIDFAERSNPGSRFSCCGLDGISEEENFDYVVTCGSFAAKGKASHRRMHEFWKYTISKMFIKCNVGIGFNVFSSRVNHFDSDFFYVSPLEVFSFCVENLSDRVAIDHATGLYESFVYVYR